MTYDYDNPYDITKMYDEKQWKMFLLVMESILRSDKKGHFKIGDHGKVISLEAKEVCGQCGEQCEGYCGYLEGGGGVKNFKIICDTCNAETLQFELVPSIEFDMQLVVCCDQCGVVERYPSEDE